MKKIIIGISCSAIVIVFILANMNLFVVTRSFNPGNGEIKKETYVLFIKISETKQKTPFGNLIEKNKLSSDEGKWVFAGTVKRNIFSKMYVCGRGGEFHALSNDFCALLELNPVNDAEKEYIRKFSELLKSENIQEISAFLKSLEKSL